MTQLVYRGSNGWICQCCPTTLYCQRLSPDSEPDRESFREVPMPEPFGSLFQRTSGILASDAEPDPDEVRHLIREVGHAFGDPDVERVSGMVRHIYDARDTPICAAVSVQLLDELVNNSPVDPASVANGFITCWLCEAYDHWRRNH